MRGIHGGVGRVVVVYVGLYCWRRIVDGLGENV